VGLSIQGLVVGIGILKKGKENQDVKKAMI